MADILISGKLTTNNSGKIIADGSNIAYESQLVGTGLMQYEKITKSVNQKIADVESTANSASTKASAVEDQLNTLRDTIEQIGQGGSGGSDPNLAAAVTLLRTDVNTLQNQVNTPNTGLTDKVSSLEQVVSGRSTGLVTKVDNLTTSVTKNTQDITTLNSTVLQLQNRPVEETDPVYTADKSKIVFKDTLEAQVNTAIRDQFANAFDEAVGDVQDAVNAKIDSLDQWAENFRNETTGEVKQVTKALLYQMDEISNCINNAVIDQEYDADGNIVNATYSILNLQQRMINLEERIQLVSQEDYDALGTHLDPTVLYLIEEESK